MGVLLDHADFRTTFHLDDIASHATSMAPEIIRSAAHRMGHVIGNDGKRKDLIMGMPYRRSGGRAVIIERYDIGRGSTRLGGAMEPPECRKDAHGVGRRKIGKRSVVIAGNDKVVRSDRGAASVETRTERHRSGPIGNHCGILVRHDGNLPSRDGGMDKERRFSAHGRKIFEWTSCFGRRFPLLFFSIQKPGARGASRRKKDPISRYDVLTKLSHG